MANNPSNAGAETFITDVEVEDLFNLYSYKLSVENTSGVDLSRLLIFYGDNGSGKTTLLKLIFNLLSPLLGRNHKTFLANTPFRRFALRLGTETYVTIQKVNNTLVGSFRATITRGRERIFDKVIPAVEEDSVFVVKKNCVESLEFSKILSDFDITLYYLSDDRRTQTSRPTVNEDQHLLFTEGEEEVLFVEKGRVQRRKRQAGDKQNLQIAIRKLERWLRAEALKGSSEGEANTNTIYADIVKRIARTEGRRANESGRSVNELNRVLREVERRSKTYSEYSLITPLQMEGLLGTLESASARTLPIIASVITPYIEGLSARLDALEEVQKLIQTFVDSINSFFHNKTISFDLHGGIKITSRKGDTLVPSTLSSGERQILLLFCNAITARDQSSIFIVDEPELSLNIKWQRKLVDVLLNCTKDSAVQFVIATHSVELLARHKAHVLRLNSQAGESESHA